MNHKAGSLLRCQGWPARAAAWATAWCVAVAFTLGSAPSVHKQDAFASEVIDTELDKVLNQGKDITVALANFAFAPLVMLFMLSSRQLISGLTAGAVK